MTDRVIAYVDGFNFYYGMMAKGWGRYRWLDFDALIQRFVLGTQTLVGVKYFTSLLEHEPDRLARQNNYLSALGQHAEPQIIPGTFEQRDLKCQVCNQWYKRPQEKRTDVNIATHLVADAFDGIANVVILVSADADLVPAVRYVKERFRIALILIDPPRRHSSELATLADAHLHFAKHQIRQCQLPDPVEYQTRKGKTRRIYKPVEWGGSERPSR